MTIGRPKKAEIILSEVEETELRAIAASRSLGHGLVRRARLILDSAEGKTNSAVARRYGISVPTVGHWRRRFMEYGLAGLYGESRPGRPRIHGDEKVMGLLQKALRVSCALYAYVCFMAESSGKMVCSDLLTCNSTRVMSFDQRTRYAYKRLCGQVY
jgi:hypothetical protein